MASDWNETSLGKVLSFSNGKTSPKRADDLNYPVYGANGIIGYSDKFNSDKNTIIIGRVGSFCGSLYFSKQKCWVTDNAICASALEENNPRYLFYLLTSLKLNRWRGGSGQPLVNQSTLCSITAKVPPLPEQRAIAHILGTLDDKIELNRRMNETLEQMAQAIFKSWFVDFDPVRAKAEGRDTGLPKHIADLFPDRFQDSEFGEIPQGWKVGTIGDEFNLTMGQSPPGKTYNETGAGSPFFQGRADFGFRYPSKRIYCTAPKRFANPGDMLVSVRAPVGDINMTFERCCIGRGLAAIRHKSGSRSYTYYLMKSMPDVFSNYEAGGTVFGCINKNDFERIDFVNPTPQIISLFENTIFPFDQMIENNSIQIESLAALRDALLPKLLSGEIRVEEAEKFIEERL